MKLKKLVKSAPKTSAKSEIVKNTHRLRTTLEAVGVGMLAFGSWVSPTFDRAAAEAIQNSKPSKKDDYMLVVEDENGTCVRKCVGDGKLFQLGKSVFSASVVPTAKVTALTLNKFSAALNSGQGVTVRFKHNKEEVTGVLLGDIEKPGATLVYRSKKGLAITDVETKACPYNTGKVVRYLKTGLPSKPLIKAIFA